VGYLRLAPAALLSIDSPEKTSDGKGPGARRLSITVWALSNRPDGPNESGKDWPDVCAATYGARLYLDAYPQFRLRMRSPSLWATFASRLRRSEHG
jgi:hypothetical protein